MSYKGQATCRIREKSKPYHVTVGKKHRTYCAFHINRKKDVITEMVILHPADELNIIVFGGTKVNISYRGEK